jgi:hypothetical protein
MDSEDLFQNKAFWVVRETHLPTLLEPRDAWFIWLILGTLLFCHLLCGEGVKT